MWAQLHATGEGIIDTRNYHGQPGDQVMIEATDDFMVKAVQVCIHDANGHLIEQGEAIMQINTDWLYAVTVANEPFAGSRITATAIDLPGNRTSMTVTVLGRYQPFGK